MFLMVNVDIYIKNNMKAIDLKGKKFGKLEVKEFAGSKNGYRYWLCQCECGKQKEIRRDHLTKNITKSCGCSWRLSRKEHNNWQGYEDISLDFFNTIKRNAIIRNIEFNITIEYLWDLFLKQNKKCKLSGLDLNFSEIRKDKSKQTSSIDRINSNIGYIEGNVQWVHKQINIMKNKLSDEKFIWYCEQVYKNNNI